MPRLIIYGLAAIFKCRVVGGKLLVSSSKARIFGGFACGALPGEYNTSQGSRTIHCNEPIICSLSLHCQYYICLFYSFIPYPVINDATTLVAHYTAHPGKCIWRWLKIRHRLLVSHYAAASKQPVTEEINKSITKIWEFCCSSVSQHQQLQRDVEARWHINKIAKKERKQASWLGVLYWHVALSAPTGEVMRPVWTASQCIGPDSTSSLSLWRQCATSPSSAHWTSMKPSLSTQCISVMGESHMATKPSPFSI